MQAGCFVVCRKSKGEWPDSYSRYCKATPGIQEAAGVFPARAADKNGIGQRRRPWSWLSDC